MSNNYTLVAEINASIAGFADIDATGYFDHLFVHKDYQGRGIATALAEAIEAHAQKSGFLVVTAAASITAKPFFENRHYAVIKRQEVKRLGQVLVNFLMEKKLS